MSLELNAVLTNKGRIMLKESLNKPTGFQIGYFDIGNAGHFVANPTVALTPDLSSLATPGKFFGPKAITSVTDFDETTSTYTCYLSETEAVGGISSLGLIATVTTVGAGSTMNLNDTFLMALVTMGLRTKTGTENLTFSINLHL